MHKGRTYLDKDVTIKLIVAQNVQGDCGYAYPSCWNGELGHAECFTETLSTTIRRHPPPTPNPPILL